LLLEGGGVASHAYPRADRGTQVEVPSELLEDHPVRLARMPRTIVEVLAVRALRLQEAQHQAGIGTACQMGDGGHGGLIIERPEGTRDIRVHEVQALVVLERGPLRDERS